MENTKKIAEKVEDVLLDLGIAPNIKGFDYLRDATVLAISNSDSAKSMTKFVYPEIAKRHTASASKVERAMRHAVELIYSRNDPEYIAKYVGYWGSPDKGKATNGEFISSLALKIKRTIGM